MDYTSRLSKSRPYQGIQAVLYDSEENKVDVDVTDEEGIYTLATPVTGSFQIRFFGGNYASDDYIDITINDPLNGLNFFGKFLVFKKSYTFNLNWGG